MIEKLVRGQMAGAAGACIMLMFMGVLHLAGFHPAREFLPLAVLNSLFQVQGAAVVLLALLCHFVYGMAWGILFVGLWPRGKTFAGALFSLAPWVVLILVMLPLMKEGFLKSSEKPWIAFSALWMHVCYGVGVGWMNGFMARRWKIECQTLVLDRGHGDGPPGNAKGERARHTLRA